MKYLFISAAMLFALGVFLFFFQDRALLRLRTIEQVADQTANVFRFHIRSDLDSMDPAKARQSLSSYLMNALHAPLMHYQNRKLTGIGAKKCELTSLQLVTCQLREDWMWSDNIAVTAEQFVLGFSRLKELRSPRLDAFQTIEDVTALSEKILQIRLSEPDADILYRLIDPAWSPARADLDMNSGRVTSGSFYLYQHERGRSLYLKPNTYFQSQPTSVDVEILIIDSDETALRLFQSDQLNFLRRLTTDMISEYKTHPGFFQVPFYRLDYIGFGPSLLAHPQLRRDLAVSLNPVYDEFVKVFDALGRPGCFGLGRFANELVEVSDSVEKYDICFEKKRVQKYSLRDQSRIPHLTLNYSTLGDEDLRRSMEFFQYGWKKNLDLQVEISPLEQSVFQNLLADSPPPLFRRGVSLERPTCLAALEVFESKSPDNWIRLQDSKYDAIVKNMRRVSDRKDLRKLCLQGLALLIESYRLIPLGALHYTMLNDQKFDNFFINELNQIDLSQLKFNTKTSN